MYSVSVSVDNATTALLTKKEVESIDNYYILWYYYWVHTI